MNLGQKKNPATLWPVSRSPTIRECEISLPPPGNLALDFLQMENPVDPSSNERPLSAIFPENSLTSPGVGKGIILRFSPGRYLQCLLVI
jgi:hypothetical protein